MGSEGGEEKMDMNQMKETWDETMESMNKLDEMMKEMKMEGPAEMNEEWMKMKEGMHKMEDMMGKMM